MGFVLIILGIVGMLYSSVFTVHETTARAMGAIAVKTGVRIVSMILIPIGLLCLAFGA